MEKTVLLHAQGIYTLVFAIVFRAAQRKFDASGFQKGGDSVVPRLAVDVTMIIGSDVEGNKGLFGSFGPPPQKGIEEFLPSRGVHLRGLGQNSVEIEEYQVIISR
jgi:hypothetical protein